MASTTIIDLGQIAQKLGLPPVGVESVARLCEEGNAIPFIAWYRRDTTGGMEEPQIRRIVNSVTKQRLLGERRQVILKSIEGQGRLTSELSELIAATVSHERLEDLYLPYKPRKLSPEEMTRRRRLEPLAREILSADPGASDLDARSAVFVDSDSKILSAADALLGAGHLLAENFSERSDVRQSLREIVRSAGHVVCERANQAGKALAKEEKHYREFFKFREHCDRIPAHRILSMNRGERAKALKIWIDVPLNDMQATAESLVVPANHPHAEFLKGCVRDSIQRLILPSLDRELRRDLTDACESHAVNVFARNIHNLLLQPPSPGRRVLALDPGFKNGCKAVVLDEQGRLVDHASMQVVGQQEKRDIAKQKIAELAKAYTVSVIAIGNGAAARETEAIVAELVAGELASLQIGYVIVNEAGAGVYATSPLAKEELPECEAAVRGAVSIGRRFQDPLTELVKIEPSHLGFGLYQHDIKAKHLHGTLACVIETCVNVVGVNLNVAGASLLRYVAGLDENLAKSICDWRTKNTRFTSRKQLLDVPGMTSAIVLQSAGFLRIEGGENPLDSTGIHPENYSIAEKILERLGGSPSSVLSRDERSAMAKRASALQVDAIAVEFSVGRFLVIDILDCLTSRELDVRLGRPQPNIKKSTRTLDELEVGMELAGPVLNVVEFGIFVDVGLSESGLVHISQISRQFIRDPHDAVSVGEVVRVWVMELDKEKKRIALTMIPPRPARPPRRTEDRPARVAKEVSGRAEREPSRTRSDQGPERSARRTPRPDKPRSISQERRPTTYVSTTQKGPVLPISKAMREGRAPLRTFGDLKQLLAVRAGLEEEPVASTTSGKKKKPKVVSEEILKGDIPAVSIEAENPVATLVEEPCAIVNDETISNSDSKSESISSTNDNGAEGIGSEPETTFPET